MQITGKRSTTVEVSLKNALPSIIRETLKLAKLDGLTNADAIFEHDGKICRYDDYGSHRGGTETKPLELSKKDEKVVRALLVLCELTGIIPSEKYINFR